MLLTAGIALAPGRGWGQEVPGPADPGWLPLPLYHDRPETGGFYAAGEFIYWHTNNPISNQVVAVRGLVDTDGNLQVARNILNPVTVDPASGQTILTTVPNPNASFPGQPATFILPLKPPAPVVGAFFGSGQSALNTEQLKGPNTYQPGFGLTLGWRFSDGFSVEFVWRRLVEAKYSAVASVIPPTYNIGRNGEDQFLFSPVFNFPPEFAGPPNKLIVFNPAQASATAAFQIIPILGITTITGPTVAVLPSAFQINAQATQNGIVVVPQGAYGIWNAATIMSESYVQRHDEYDLIGRMPIYQNDCSRWWVTAGARHVSIWERYFWRTVSVQSGSPSTGASVNITNPGTPATVVTVSTATTTTTTVTGAGAPTITATAGASPIAAPAVSGADDVADYSNVVSNQLYGPSFGCGSEWYLGWGFSFAVDVRATLAIDMVHEIAKYERQDHAIASKRGRREYTLSPEVDAMANIYWYPYEGIELRFGYDYFNFFNTVSSPQPVDFNYGAVAPAWEKNTYRYIDGFHAGIGFIF
jgi:hypothetical protein